MIIKISYVEIKATNKSETGSLYPSQGNQKNSVLYSF
jgi:hypothetical protein